MGLILDYYSGSKHIEKKKDQSHRNSKKGGGGPTYLLRNQNSFL